MKQFLTLCICGVRGIQTSFPKKSQVQDKEKRPINNLKTEQKILKSSHDWDEDWDAEAESAPVVGTYNPMNKIINSDNPILL